MDQIGSDGFTTFKVSKDVTMYKVTFKNHYKMNVSNSNAKFTDFYPFNDIETISPRPTLFITGDKAHSKEFSEDAYKRAAEPKELFYIKNAGHVDLYDKVDLIPFDKLDTFFKQHLK